SEIDFSSINLTTGNTRNLNLSLGLGTTAATPGNTGGNYAANKGPDFTTVFSGAKSFTGAGNGTFDLQFPVTPFLYDPSKGNFLLDVVINSSAGNGVFFFFGDTPDAGRIFNSRGNGAATADPLHGLETRFTVAAAAVPEPSTLALLGLGGAALLGWGR